MTEKKLTAVEWGERITGPVHMGGVVCGIEEAVKILRIRSGAYYADGSDEHASVFRLAAEVLENNAEGRRGNYTSFRYAEQKEEAFAALDEIDRELEAYRAQNEEGPNVKSGDS